MRRISTLLMLVGLAFPAASVAADIILRTAVEPAEAWVGQRVVLQIDVLGADGWAQIGRFDDIELPGAYLVRTDSQGTRLQETIDGVAYTGQRYAVSVYPQKAGAITVPSLPVEITVKTWGADASESLHERETPPATIKASMPPGAEQVRGLVSTTILTAEQAWSPAIEAAKVGDALRRSVTLQADDISGMAFAPLPQPEMPGIGIYPDEPVVTDSADRGTLRGQRTEAVTYVFERAGVVQIPAIDMTWWNVSTEKLETITLPGREFDVAPGPVGGADSVGLSASERIGLRDLWLPGIVVIVAAALLLRYLRRLSRHWRAWQRRRRESESRYFKHALQSVRSKQARLALRDIMRWLDRIDDGPAPAQLQGFASRHGGTEAQDAVDQLLVAVAGDGRLADPATLTKSLTAMRLSWEESCRPQTGASFALPDLN